MITRCRYHTGYYEGRCGAGVEYESVKDQNRRDERARYPCDADPDCFTACAKFEKDKYLEKISRAISKPIKLDDTGYVSKRTDAILLAITRDGRGAFVEVKKTGRKYSKKKLVGLEVVHLTRKK